MKFSGECREGASNATLDGSEKLPIMNREGEGGYTNSGNREEDDVQEVRAGVVTCEEG